MTHAERCQAESTRDVIFLLQWRQATSLAWTTEGVWLDRAEAEAFRVSRAYEWPHSRVYGVPADGQLAELTRRDPMLPCEWETSRAPHNFGDMVTDCRNRYGRDKERNDFNFCPYCGRPIEIKEAP